MASIRDVAKQAGVGVGTVSRALNGTGYVSPATRKKIEKAVDQLGYTPNELARNLFRNRTGIVGVMVPDLDHPFFSCLAKNVEMELYRQGYKTMICNTVGISDREKEYLDMLERNMVDGIITASHTLEEEEYRKRTKPIVSVDRNFGPEIPLIGSDHAAGGSMAARLLVESGCRRVLQISSVSPNVAAADRHAAFAGFMAEHRIEVMNLVMDWNVFNWEASHREITRFFRNYPNIDGAFGSDQAAISCMNIALQKGRRVPEDFCVVGFDGMDITRMVYPTLTAICQNVQLLSELAVSTLLDLVEERKSVPNRQILDVTVQNGGTIRGQADQRS